MGFLVHFFFNFCFFFYFDYIRVFYCGLLSTIP